MTFSCLACANEESRERTPIDDPHLSVVGARLCIPRSPAACSLHPRFPAIYRRPVRDCSRACVRTANVRVPAAGGVTDIALHTREGLTPSPRMRGKSAEVREITWSEITARSPQSRPPQARARRSCRRAPLLVALEINYRPRGAIDRARDLRRLESKIVGETFKREYSDIRT